MTHRPPRGPRAYVPKEAKPLNGPCGTCPAVDRCTGYVPGMGEVSLPVLHLGESPAVDEQIQGRPFAGAAGSMHTRVLRLMGRAQDHYRVDNLVRGTLSVPIEAAPDAVAHCRYWRDGVDAHPPQVVVPMGAVALRAVLALTGKKGVRVQDFHGTVTRDPSDRFWVVPTYHPSHLQRGATNLMGTVAFDLARADEVAKVGWAPDPGVLVLDPPVDWFAAWVETYLAAAAQDPYAYPLAVDIETPEKGSDEGELVGTVEDATFQILRVNVSCNPDEGVTVPFEGGYIPLLQRLLAVNATQGYWFKGYDVPRLRASGCAVPAAFALDFMWAWKALQSDLPGGLGFVAPFYSRWGAWKHLAESAPAKYAAIDALQTRRILDGITADLVRLGRWEVFSRHQHRFHQVVLQPATDVGVPIDRARLTAFKAKLDVEAGRLLDAIQAHVPPDLCPLTPKLGLTRPPLPTDIHTKGRDVKKDGTPKKEAEDPLKKALYARARVVEQLVLREVLVCKTCGTVGVIKTHRCQGGLFDGAPEQHPALAKEIASVRRWFWQEPFNPDSPKQLMGYVLAKGHTPGKAKATGEDSVDRETLSRLIRETEDPLYQAVLDYRAVAKVRGTYVLGTERRLDAEDRIHPTFGFKPSTMRLNATNPNIQNCVREGTPIEILRDVSEYPLGIPIEHVRVGDLAYTFTEEGTLTLKPVTAVHRNGVRPLVRVHWRGSPRRTTLGHVDLTPDHLVRLASGEWKPAGQLVAGDRVCALARLNSEGYELLYATGMKQVREHRFAYLTLNPGSTPPEHIHHRNQNRRDNRPQNLEGIAVGAHFSHHNKGEGNPRWRTDWKDTDPRERRRRSYREYDQRNNHRVLAVEHLAAASVYDLTIADTHNYIAGEVCVHNCIADKGGSESLASGFRLCVVAKRASWMIEFDYAGIEQVLMGWFMGDPEYIRIAKLGTHAIVASHVLKRPADLRWPDAQLAEYLKGIKKAKDAPTQLIYDQSKRTVHGTAYGLTVHGMMRNFPKTFPTVKSAEAVQGVYFAVAPGVPKFHTAVRDTAYRTHHLGGSPPYTYDADAREVHGHPYGYQHWFWSVVGYDRLTVSQRLFREKRKLPMIEVNGIWYGVSLGEDAKRAVAMYPQGTARGVLTEAAFPLFDPEDALADRCYIGDAWYGQTPLRAPIHDSFLMEVPADQVDRVVAATAFAMQRPIAALPCPPAWGIGTHLTINVDAKIGPDWGTMKGLEVPTLQDIGVARDLPAVSDEDEDVDDVLDFETTMGAA